MTQDDKNIPFDTTATARNEQFMEQLGVMQKKLKEKRNEEAAKLACDKLNAVLAHDQAAVSALIEMRVFCDPKVGDTTCPAVPLDDGSGNLSLGVLGLIQAIIPAEYRIVANCGDDGVVSEFVYRKCAPGS